MCISAVDPSRNSRRWAHHLYPHFTDENAEAQRAKLLPKATGNGELGLEPSLTLRPELRPPDCPAALGSDKKVSAGHGKFKVIQDMWVG